MKLRDAMESVAEVMGEPIDWSLGGIRKYFGGDDRCANVEMEVRIQTDIETMKVYILVRTIFRQRTCDNGADSVEYAAHATEAAALAFAVENDVGELRWSWEDHRDLYAQLRAERQNRCRYPGCTDRVYANRLLCEKHIAVWKDSGWPGNVQRWLNALDAGAP